METSTITTLIGSLGFPIVACIAMGWYVVKIQTKNNLIIEKLSDNINSNTIALTSLINKIK